MSLTPAMAELERKHREIVGEILLTDEHAKVLREQLKVIEAALSVIGYEGEIKTEALPRPQFRIFERGEITRAVLDLGRERPDLRKPTDIAKEIVRRKGWDSESMALWGRVTAAVKDCKKRRRALAVTTSKIEVL